MRTPLILSFLIVFFLDTNVFSQTYQHIAADDTRILFDGVSNLVKTTDSVIINRHSPDFYAKVKGYIGATKGRTQTGVVIRFNSNSPTLKLYFKNRADADQRELTFGVYKDGVLYGYQKKSLEFTLQSDNAMASWEIVLPFFYGVHFAGIDIESGSAFEMPALSTKPKYVAIGNSITHGTGQSNVASDGTYAFRFAKAMGWELYNLAVGGSRITPLIADETKDLQLHAISVLWGINDWNGGYSVADDVAPRYRQLLTNLRSYHPDAFIYCIMPIYTLCEQPRNGAYTYSVDTLRNVERRIVNEFRQNGDLKFIILEGGILTTADDLNDSLHLNNAGAANLATALIKTAKETEMTNEVVSVKKKRKI